MGAMNIGKTHVMPARGGTIHLFLPLVLVLMLVVNAPLYVHIHHAARGEEAYGELSPLLRDVREYGSASSGRDRETIHVMFALSGNHPGFLAEFEVAFKSVLLNAPIDDDLAVHVLADGAAYEAVPEVFDRAGIKDQPWWTRVDVATYNIQSSIQGWKTTVKDIVGFIDGGHTFGAYYRLFAHEILPKHVRHVIYIDSDVVLMANLYDAWRHIDSDALFQWGPSQCSGFILLNIEKFNEFWNIAKQTQWKGTIGDEADQGMFKKVQEDHPHLVSTMPIEWDVSVASGGNWKFGDKLFEKRPNVGMLHFNGGGESKDPYFADKESFPTKYPRSWGLVQYYVNLPWSMVAYMGSSKRRRTEKNIIHIFEGQVRSKPNSQ